MGKITKRALAKKRRIPKKAKVKKVKLGEPKRRIGRSKRKAVEKAVRHEHEKVRREAEAQLPATNAHAVSAIGQALKVISKHTELPLLAMDKRYIDQVLKGLGLDPVSRRNMPSLRRLEAENIALWVRRLIAADLWAQGKSAKEIGLQLGTKPRVIQEDLRQVAHFKLLANTADEANRTIMSMLNRMEHLQKSAFKDLTALNEEQYVTRAELRKEIEARELRVFDVVKTLGFLQNATVQPVEKEDKGKGVDVHVEVNVDAPKPLEFYQNLTTDQLQSHMAEYVEALRTKQLQKGAIDADFQDRKPKQKTLPPKSPILPNS